MKERGYFNPDDDTQPQEDKEKKGRFSIPHWNVLPYLERVSEQVNVPENEKYIDELLSIIKEVTQYHIENEKILDNYRTWWYFVKILLNLPNDKIPIDVIEMTRIWLDSKFDNMLPGSDIAIKLLPKFLDSDNPDDWEKAEKIVEIITDIQWFPLPEEGSLVLRKSEEPKTILESYWLEESFKVNAQKIGEKCSENIIFVLADRIKEIFRKEYKSWTDVEFNNKHYRISIQPLGDEEYQVTVGKIKEEDLVRTPEEQYVKSFRSKPEKLFEFRLENCRNEKEFVDAAKKYLITNENFAGLKDEFDEELEKLYRGIFADYSYIWFKSLYSEPTIHKVKQILTVILRDIVLAKAKKIKSIAKKVLDRFLSNEYQYPLFRRIVLFVIGNEWNVYKHLFWQMIGDGKADDLFDNANYEPETYELLQRNVSQFTSEEKEKIKNMVEKGPQRYLPDENQEEYIAYWKQKWYSAVKSDSYFETLYEEMKKKTEIEERPSFREPTVRVGPGPSPLSKEEILQMPNKQLAEFLITFKTEDPWRGSSIEALSYALKTAVQEKPEKFIDLSPFLSVGYLYVYEILWGIRDAWNGKKAIDWGKLLEFIRQYINRDDFWEDKFKVKGDILSANHLWVTGMVGELVREGTKDDSWAFPEEHFQAAKEIIFLILDKQRFEEKEDIREYVTHALNSPFGKAITALIYLALRIARVEDKGGVTKEVKWEPKIKDKYEDVLRHEIIESFTLFGQYLPNFYYLDKKWAEEKINEITLAANKTHWEAFMTGYLFGGKVYNELYELMRPHYLDALDYGFKEKHVAELLIQHICIGYLRGQESIDDKESLFRKVLDKWQYSQIEEIIKFFWMYRDYPDENIKEKVISFWRWVYENKYKDTQQEELSDEDKKALSDLSKLTVFLPKIDSQNFKWLMLFAPYIHAYFNYPFFIEYLDKFEDEGSVSHIGKIVVQMLLSAPTLSDYKHEHMQSIVEKLYKTGNKDSADKICNIYGSQQLDFLRDIYGRNNP